MHLTLFNLERLYSHILVLVPHQRHPISDMPELDKAMVFEYCVQYAELLHPVTTNINYHPFFSYADMCRARWVGKQFLEVMWSDFDRLLKAQHIIAGNVSSGTSVFDNCNRALACVRQISDILSIAATKCQVGDLKELFEKESAVLVARLSNRQQEATPPAAPAVYSHYLYTDAPPYPSMHSGEEQRISPGSRRVYEFTGSGQL